MKVEETAVVAEGVVVEKGRAPMAVVVEEVPGRRRGMGRRSCGGRRCAGMRRVGRVWATRRIMGMVGGFGC